MEFISYEFENGHRKLSSRARLALFSACDAAVRFPAANHVFPVQTHFYICCQWKSLGSRIAGGGGGRKVKPSLGNSVLSLSGFRSQWIPDGPDGLGAVLQKVRQVSLRNKRTFMFQLFISFCRFQDRRWISFVHVNLCLFPQAWF